jgi:hypothetical protein
VRTDVVNLEGFALPCPASTSKLFQPDWWYWAQFGMGRSREVPGWQTAEEHRAQIEAWRSEPAWADRRAQIDEWLKEPKLERHELWTALESEVNGLVWDGLIREFQVTHGPDRCDEFGCEYDHEAWIPCTFELNEGWVGMDDEHWVTLEGRLTWENSD